jgi:hypothetical protein
MGGLLLSTGVESLLEMRGNDVVRVWIGQRD